VVEPLQVQQRGRQIVYLDMIVNRAPTDFITFGSSWRYLDNDSNQGTAWSKTNFNHST